MPFKRIVHVLYNLALTFGPSHLVVYCVHNAASSIMICNFIINEIDIQVDRLYHTIISYSQPFFYHDLRRAGLPAEFKHITKRRKRK